MNVIGLFILVIVCLGIGYFANSLLRSSKDDPAARLAPPRRDGIWLWKEPDGGLQMEMDGQPLTQPESLSEDQRRMVADWAQELARWGTEISAQVVESLPPTIEPLAPKRVDPPPEAPIVLPATAAPAQPIASPPRSKPSFNPINLLTRAIDADLPKLRPEPPMSIVAQVNAILQEKIKSTPYATRGLQLSETMDHAMQVVLGLEKFDGIEAVPDAEIQALIRACVAEWSERSTSS